MFGSLFDDERPAGVMTNVHTLAVSRPPNRRLRCGLSGIENQGATCYLNSLLQTLLYTPEFREGLFGLSETELGNLENREKGGKVRIIPLQLQRLFARLLLVDQQAASTTELTDSFGWSNNEELQQHDVQELNRILFSAIDSSLVGTVGKDLISKLYHGSTVSEIVCQICGKISEREEDFLDLNVIVANYSNLQDSLNATFLQQEIMKGKNQYRCSTCCNLVDAKKGSKIQCLPAILTFSLLRFSYDIAKGERYKETGKFVFPFEIDMAPYCTKEMKPGDSIYELFSVVIHSGCSYGGHYHAYIRDVDGLGTWLPPEDEPFTVIGDTTKEGVVDAIQDPVSLLKAILSEKEDHCLPVEVLCGEITKWTGVSWNKRFKSMHGVIVKFLQKHNDIFHYNASTNMVYLKNETTSSESVLECSNSSPSDLENATCSLKETKKYAVMNSLKLNFFDKKRAQGSHSAYSHNWFDFNDSKVSSILVRDIEKQYSGKESAYMLFYRRKSLIRPSEAKGNPKYGMPEKLTKLAEEENFELERLREDYETALNTVNLQVHLGNNYKCSNGVLEPKLGEMAYLDLAIDKRKILLDLRDCISKVCADFCASQNFILHTAREVPAGLHLYEELSESQNLEPLKDLGILEGTKIFVWDGSQVGGEHFAIGVAHEPVLLNISVTLPNGEASEMSRGFPKTTTIGELKIFISTLTPLPLEDIRVSRLDLQGEDSKLSPLTENHDGHTLAELSFIDGDNIVAESVKCEQMQVKEVNSVKIIVQNCCNSMTAEDDNFELIELTVDLDSTVENLRNLAVSDLHLDEKQSYVIRKLAKNQNKRLPLHEHQSIREVGLLDTSYVSIEEGIPPTLEQITIIFTVGVGVNDGPSFEITVLKNTSIQECLKEMLTISGLTGDSWHLRKTNWCGEPMEQLNLDGATLEEEGIQHGEYLLIMEGRLPPKGFLNFSIWLFPTLENIPIPPAVNMNGLHSDIESLLQNFGECMSKRNSTCGVKIGEVELSSESTVGDLKKYVLTLPSLSNLFLPSIRYLRLRLLDNGRPGRVLRGLSNSLKKLKIQSYNSLAAQVLLKEEDLMQTEMLLHVCQRLPDTKSYTPPLELAWDTSKSASPKSLKQAVADGLSCPVQRIVIAKRFPEKCQWLIIDDGTNSKKGNKKKRWGTGKSNLRHSPYFLKDGDTIGVKDRLSDPNDVDDFLTPEDIEGQEILKIAAENKRIKRQEDKSPSRCSEWMLGGSDRELPRHAKKSEVGITIHVDDFT